MTARLDPVVHKPVEEWGAGPIDLEDIARFEREGYLFLEGLFPLEEVRALRAEFERLRNSEAIRKSPESIAEPTSREVRSIFSVHTLSPVFDRLARDPRLLRIAEFLLDDRVYIHQSRVNIKPAFEGKEFYWHSDFETWHVEDGMPCMRAVSFSISLTDNNNFNGPLMVVPGSHKVFVSCVGETPEEHYKASLKKQEYGVPDNDSLSTLIERGGLTAPTGRAGSLLIFDCNTMHASSGNLSPWPRTNLFFVYNSVENRLGDPYCGLAPRPDYIGARSSEALEPVE